jgi:hypothetical protein
MSDRLRSTVPIDDEAPHAESRGASSLARARVVGRLLDEAIRVPGTSVRIGLDPLIGLVPGVGDVVGAVASAYIVLEAARAGAPASVLARMLGNVGIDAVVGALPLAGDVFDFAWKSNTRNVRLLERHLAAPRATRRASRALAILVVAGALLVGLASIAAAILLVRALL